MSKSAVDWLVEQVEDFYCLLPVDMIEQAKQLERENMIKFAEDYELHSWKQSNDNRYVQPKSAEQYYNETFNNHD